MTVEELRAACLEPSGLDGEVPGHLGRVCSAKETKSGFDVVAVFERKAILDFIS